MVWFENMRVAQKSEWFEDMSHSTLQDASNELLICSDFCAALMHRNLHLRSFGS